MDESGTSVVREYMAAWPSNFDALSRLRAPDFIEEWPQSGERIRGDANYRKIHSNFPGGMPKHETDHIFGTPDQWAVTPMFTLVHVTGSGGAYTVEGTLTYPGGEAFRLVAVLDVKDQRVRSQRTYFAPVFDAPAWRAEWVEKT